MKVQNANTGKWHSPRTEFFANTDIRKNAENAKHDKKKRRKKHQSHEIQITTNHTNAENRDT